MRVVLAAVVVVRDGAHARLRLKSVPPMLGIARCVTFSNM